MIACEQLEITGLKNGLVTQPTYGCPSENNVTIKPLQSSAATI